MFLPKSFEIFVVGGFGYLKAQIFLSLCKYTYSRLPNKRACHLLENKTPILFSPDKLKNPT